MEKNDPNCIIKPDVERILDIFDDGSAKDNLDLLDGIIIRLQEYRIEKQRNDELRAHLEEIIACALTEVCVIQL